MVAVGRGSLVEFTTLLRERRFRSAPGAPDASPLGPVVADRPRRDREELYDIFVSKKVSRDCSGRAIDLSSASSARIVRSQDDLDPLKLFDVGVPGGRQGATQRPHDVDSAIGPVRRAGQDLGHSPDGAHEAAVAARQALMTRLGSPVVASAARARAAPSMTASAPQAMALTTSPELPTEPSATTWT